MGVGRSRAAGSAIASKAWPRPGKRCAIHRLRPTTAMTAPTTKNAGPNGTPAAIIAMPAASTSGAAVGWGISTFRTARPDGSSPAGPWNSESCVLFVMQQSLSSSSQPGPSASEEVNDREHHEPNGIDKMPVPANQLNAGPVMAGHVPECGQAKYNKHHDDAHGHMDGVQPNER